MPGLLKYGTVTCCKDDFGDLWGDRDHYGSFALRWDLARSGQFITKKSAEMKSLSKTIHRHIIQSLNTLKNFNRVSVHFLRQSFEVESRLFLGSGSGLCCSSFFFFPKPTAHHLQFPVVVHVWFFFFFFREDLKVRS